MQQSSTWGARTRVVVLVALAVTAGSVVGGTLLLAQAGLDVVGQVVFVLSGSLNAVVGALVLRRHPRHRVGWLLLLIGVLVTSGFLCEQLSLYAYVDGHEVPGAMVALWYVQWYWLPFVYAQFVGLPLLFPTGRPLSPSWGRFARVLLVVAVVASIGGMFADRLWLDFTYLEGQARSFVNPVGFLPISDIESEALVPFVIGPLQLGGLAALWSLVSRYRRSRGVERQQMKWGALGVGVTLLTFVAWALLDGLFAFRLPVADGVTNAVAPIAMGMAIMRYRLWDVDRFVSRTVAYVAVSALLAAGYATLVLAVQGVGGPRNVPDVVVAAATLVAAALFGPLRRRVQRLVDRRFNRSRYDADHVLADFADGLRDQVDAGVVAREVRHVVHRTMQPSESFVWLPSQVSS